MIPYTPGCTFQCGSQSRSAEPHKAPQAAPTCRPTQTPETCPAVYVTWSINDSTGGLLAHVQPVGLTIPSAYYIEAT